MGTVEAAAIWSPVIILSAVSWIIDKIADRRNVQKLLAQPESGGFRGCDV